jgi:hypothetical protein
MFQNLEERQNGSHRDRAATVMEVTLLKDQVQTKQHQLDMEMKVGWLDLTWLWLG